MFCYPVRLLLEVLRFCWADFAFGSTKFIYLSPFPVPFGPAIRRGPRSALQPPAGRDASFAGLAACKASVRCIASTCLPLSLLTMYAPTPPLHHWDSPARAVFSPPPVAFAVPLGALEFSSSFASPPPRIPVLPQPSRIPRDPSDSVPFTLVNRLGCSGNGFHMPEHR